MLPVLTSAHDVTTPPWQKATGWPDRIIATATEDPTRSFAVTWRTAPTVGRTLAQIVPASADARFDISARTVPASSDRLDLTRFTSPEGSRDYLENQELGATHHHSVTFSDLEPDTLYAYRVQGERGKWSEWIQVRTAPASGPITLLYLGDAQQGVRTHWARVIRQAHQTAPETDLVLHAGDLVHQGPSDRDWAGWFDAGSFHHAQTLAVPVLGNHEHFRVRDPAGGRGPRIPTPLWRAQFTLPASDNLPEELQEIVYRVDVGSQLSIFVLDSTPSRYNLDQGYQHQSSWLKQQLADSAAQWKVVSMHHPYFVPIPLGGREQARQAMRDAFDGPVKAGGVDLVLTGHIHFYSRLSDQSTTRVSGADGQVETVYLISAASASQGDVLSPDDLRQAEPKEGIRLHRAAENTPMFQVIHVDGNRLSLAAHTAVGDLYDEFVLEKADDGSKIMLDGPAASGPTRLFEQHTGEYRDAQDLR